MADGLGPPLAEPLFPRIAVIGIGLIGSSIVRAARRRRAAGEIVLSDASADVVARARAHRHGDA
jgi:cyclohexadieny/prephenate dehydrogenase